MNKEPESVVSLDTAHAVSAEAVKSEVFTDVPVDEPRYTLEGWARPVMLTIATAFSLFQLYSAFIGLYPPQIQRGVHLGFALTLVFLLFGFRGRNRQRVPWYDVVLALIGAGVGLYQVLFYDHIINSAGDFNLRDEIVAGIAVLILIEATRRAVGMPLVILMLAAMFYAFAGPWLPGGLHHAGFSIQRIVSQEYLSTEGIFGTPLAVSSTFVFLFILFGAVLRISGLGKSFIDIALSLAGHTTGGPAKVAIVASSLFGTISGSSTANAVTIGSFTIPLMKSIGYKPHYAAGIEAAAGTGGQLMPPIMGVAAFVMSEMIGVPYLKIAAAAALPAVLYYTCLMISVHLEAKRLGLKGLERSRLPKFGPVLLNAAPLAIPLFGLIYLLVTGWTPLTSALAAIAGTLMITPLRKASRMGPRKILRALQEGATAALTVAVACAAAGMVVGMITLSGAGLAAGYGLVELSGGILIFTLILTAISSLVLGTAVPTTANYIITATVAAPALVKLGVPLLPAHLFVFYFGIIADITPPVALAAYAASGIAGSDPMKTGLTATRLAISAYLVPFIFALSPALLLVDAPITSIIEVIPSSIIGIVGLSAAAMGYWRRALPMWQRAMLLAGALALLTPGIVTDIAGLAALGLVWFLQRREDPKAALASNAASTNEVVREEISKS
ncbi:MAG: TRAP transporter permease [Bacteroidetes bacterium]|nr:TRAP transporter permease [Bacteroidota bacterium]